MPTIHELVASARLELRQAGIAGTEADLDARILAQVLLRWDAAGFFAHADAAASGDFAQGYRVLVQRRVQREPMAYISGVQEFWNLSFEVTPAVLIPRPETELIVETFLAHHPDRRKPLRVADIGTGSGCLAVAVAHERPAARVTATDLSPDALAIAARNIARHGVGGRVGLVRADLLEGITGPFDAIVSNPPYVPVGDQSTMPPEVVEHEPHGALFAGLDGLAVIRSLVEQAGSRLAPGGLLLFELGFGQSKAVAALLDATPALQRLELHRDLQGIPRAASAIRIA